MNDKGLQLFFVTKSGIGFEEGVYSQKEIASLPSSARPHIISLAVAESMGYVVLDHNKVQRIEDCKIFAAPDQKTGKLKKLRGVLEGTLENPKESDKPLGEKIGNSLRNTFQDIKQKSAEDSLKAKIEAKKLELNNTKE